MKGMIFVDIEKCLAELAKCKDCGNSFAPMATLKYLKERIELPDDFFELCSGCRRKKLGKELVNIVGNSSDSSSP